MENTEVLLTLHDGRVNAFASISEVALHRAG